MSAVCGEWTALFLSFEQKSGSQALSVYHNHNLAEVLPGLQQTMTLMNLAEGLRLPWARASRSQGMRSSLAQSNRPLGDWA